MALTLLHTADWHLGRRFPAFERDQEQQLTRARLDAVGRILDLAESRNVDAVLCAGDLFDDPSPAESWWGGVLREFAHRDWTRPVILLPGNHDPLMPKSLYDPSHPFRAGLPGYVHVADRKGWELPLGDGAVVLASPCTSRAGQTDLAASLPVREAGDERIRIGLVHGQTFDIEGHQTNFPIASGTAVDHGLDYLAIGDTHAYREVEPDAAAPTVYPGAPEATNFGERDTGNVALVFFPRDRPAGVPSFGRSPVGRWTWREETCTSLAALRRAPGRPEPASHRAAPRPRHGAADGRVRRGGAPARTRCPAPWRPARSVGVLTVDRERFRLAADAPIEFGAQPARGRARHRRAAAGAGGDGTGSRRTRPASPLPARAGNGDGLSHVDPPYRGPPLRGDRRSGGRPAARLQRPSTVPTSLASRRWCRPCARRSCCPPRRPRRARCRTGTPRSRPRWMSLSRTTTTACGASARRSPAAGARRSWTRLATARTS